MAQIMRYHQYPTKPITPQERICSVRGTSTNLLMIGGTYAWDLMPPSPQWNSPAAHREEIGKLTYDCGVSVHMQYDEGGSGTFVGYVPGAFTNVFGYKTAKYYVSNTGLSADIQKKAILSNLDAGYPVLLGISDDNKAGHAVVADGYGYQGSTCYVHLNMGWKGTSDAWYNLPLVDSSSYAYPYTFTCLDEVVYNICPSYNGEFVSGRVLDAGGNPIANATVSAKMNIALFGTTSITNTDALGRYCFGLSHFSFDFSVTHKGLTVPQGRITIEKTETRTLYSTA